MYQNLKASASKHASERSQAVARDENAVVLVLSQNLATTTTKRRE
jgi:hypothetical protein